MTPEEFRAAGYRLIDWIADYRAGIEARPVMAKSSPGEILAQLRPRPRNKRNPSTQSSATSIASCCRASPRGSIRASSAISQPVERCRACWGITSAAAWVWSGSRGSRARP
jgi:hypothetical protein